MRVRHLQTHLSDQQLVLRARLDRLRNSRVGVDAVFWLRSIQALKDPFADALGGIPPGIFGFVDKELEFFKRYGITPLFVFQGVPPGPQQAMFVSRMDQQMELAWHHLANGQKSEAQKRFAVSTSRINGEFVYFIYHHLRNKGYECLQAPYFSGAQLAHFAERGVVQWVFGPPGLLLFGLSFVVIQIDYSKQIFEWVDLVAVLHKWQITKEQFVDACMLAGTEYCLTYPYLNLGHFQPAPNAVGNRFHFDAAVYIVKQASIAQWMQTFPSEEMKLDHLSGYCTCKVLVENSPVLDLADHSIRPLGATREPAPEVPVDIYAIMGEMLPNAIYYLLCSGIISYKLPQALAKGEWTDKTQPLVDTTEYRSMLVDLSEYRQTALGLIAQHLHPSFQGKSILFKAFWDHPSVRQASPINGEQLPADARIITPRKIAGVLDWKITTDRIQEEMKRQGRDSADLIFCVNWHAKEFETDGPLIPRQIASCPTCSADLHCLTALINFMLLEHLGLIADDGGITVLSNLLKDTPPMFQYSTLCALELMKFGVLTNEPFTAHGDRPFPEDLNYPKPPCNKRTRAMLLLTRVMSLVPMKLKNDMWNADVDFDLAAFHALVRILLRTLRQLVEASLASVIMKEWSLVKVLPPGFMSASPKKDSMQTLAVLPNFMLPRACMGIVVKHFLEFREEPSSFARDTALKFPCCVQPIEDLKMAFAFWKDLHRCVDSIAEQLDCQELSNEMKMASHEILYPQQKRLGIFPMDI